MLKIKKDINPIGTFQLVRIQLAGGYTWHKYKVIEVTGNASNTPNQDSPIICMDLAEKNPGTLQQFISLPLSVFGVGEPNQRVMPLEGTDKFWYDDKVVEA
jgi:hypothetical protein